jgi:hypothetical protein
MEELSTSMPLRRNALDVIGKRKMEFGIRKEIKRVV